VPHQSNSSIAGTAEQLPNIATLNDSGLASQESVRADGSMAVNLSAPASADKPLVDAYGQAADGSQITLPRAYETPAQPFFQPAYYDPYGQFAQAFLPPPSAYSSPYSQSAQTGAYQFNIPYAASQPAPAQYQPSGSYASSVDSGRFAGKH